MNFHGDVIINILALCLSYLIVSLNSKYLSIVIGIIYAVHNYIEGSGNIIKYVVGLPPIINVFPNSKLIFLDLT